VATGSKLSVRDEVKPFVLIAAVVAGIVANRLVNGRLAHLDWIANIAVFVVMFAVMAFVEVKDIGVAFKKIRPTGLALLTNFVFVPAFAWVLGWLILRHYPDIWAGVILYTLTPCIGWYLIFTDLAEGDVPWGVSLLPWNLTLQILLLPFYLWLLVGKVVPISVATLFGSVALYLLAPLALAYGVRTLLEHTKGHEWTYGTYKSAIGEIKMWALAALVITIFAFQQSFSGLGLVRIGLIIGAISLFFVGLFALSLTVGRRFRLGYADTATLVFTTTARNSESVIGVAAVAFVGHPLVLVAILVGPVIELPALLILSRFMLRLRTRLSWPDMVAAVDAGPPPGTGQTVDSGSPNQHPPVTMLSSSVDVIDAPHPEGPPALPGPIGGGTLMG